MTLLDAAEKPVAGVATSTVADAEAALAWAERVGRDGEEALANAPSRPDEAALLALGATRVREGIGAIITGRHAQEGLDALQQSGVMAAWLPEVEALVGFGDGEWRHKDVWKHTKQVVWQSVPRLEVRWGALLHDIGKVRTRRIDDDGQVHFFGHSEVGARMYRKKLAARLGFTGHLDERIHYLILFHLRASQYEPGWTDSAVRRFAREMGDGLTDLLDLSRADITTKRPERKKRGLRQISDLAARIAKLDAEDQKPVPLPKGVGNAIMAHFKLPASRRIGEIKRALEERVEAGTLEGGLESEFYVAWLEQRRDEFGL
jgi:poly(A) polymerase